MKAILTDVTRCVGCERCVAACVVEHRLAESPPMRWSSEDGLGAERFTSVVKRGGAFVRKQCRHCLEPACASACPVGALRKTPEGPVIYDRDRCLGCRYCMMACPFGIPRYAWAAAVPYVRKCSLCAETRLKQGRQPACTEACPAKATIFGERTELLAEAHRRLAAEPGRYLPRVWGETEIGGTCVLYVAPIALDFLFVGVPQDARVLPRLTATAMSAVPPAFVTVGAVMGGVYWIIERRRRLAAERSDAPAAAPGSDEEKAP